MCEFKITLQNNTVDDGYYRKTKEIKAASFSAAKAKATLFAKEMLPQYNLDSGWHECMRQYPFYREQYVKSIKEIGYYDKPMLHVYEID